MRTRALHAAAILWTVVVAFSVKAGEAACHNEGDVRSLRGDVHSSVKFVNRCTTPIDIYWLDYGGNRQFYARLGPGWSYRQRTYESHPWLMAGADGVCMAIVDVTKPFEIVNLCGEPPVS